jgi:hypothetical protein
MAISMYSSLIPVLKQMLSSLHEILTKAEVHAAEKKIDPNALLQARLFPDMFSLVRQVQLVTDFGKSIPARLAGIEVPTYEDNEQSFADLKARINKTLSFIATFTPAQIDGSENREVVTQAGTPKEKRFLGQTYLLHYGLPNLFFHVTTAYAILRHNGVEIGKKDFIGTF